jgi:hypothetical protein
MKKAVDRVRPAAEEIDSAVEGFTTDADLYIIWREVRRTIASDDDSLFNTKMLNGLYAADYAGTSWLMPLGVGLGLTAAVAAIAVTGGAAAPGVMALATAIGKAGLTVSAASLGAAITGIGAAGAAVIDGLQEYLEDDPQTAGAASNMQSLALADEAYDEVDPTTGKPAEIAMEAVRDVMTGIARGNITDKLDALTKLEAPLKAEEVLAIVEKG